jgi:O-antigen/teichoic acid export membrane protein
MPLATDRDSQSVSESQVFRAVRTSHVGRLTRNGVIASVVLLAVRQPISLIGTAIIARFVTPADFGLVAMAATFTAFLALVGDMGLSWATVQQRQLDREQVDALFWVGGLLGLMLWIAAIACAPLVANFYGVPRLALVCSVSSVVLVINGFTIQPAALLKRGLRQRTLSRVDTQSLAGASAIGVLFAILGFGWWAIVAQSVFQATVRLAGLMAAAEYKPRPPKVCLRLLPILRVGGYVGACNLITYFQLNLDNILIGRYWGATELAFYSRAFSIRALPAALAAMAITDVMVPALARLESEPVRLAAAYRKAVVAIGLIGCPLGALLVIAAPDLVRIMYGRGWEPMAPMLVWLSLPAITWPIYQTMGWLFIATGRVRQMFLLSVIATPIVGFAFAAALPWGGLGVAVAGAILFTVPLPLVSLHYAHRTAAMQLSDTLTALRPVLRVTVCFAVASIIAGSIAARLGGSWAVVFAAKLTAGLAVYGFVATPDLISLVADLRQRSQSGPAATDVVFT